MTTPGAIGKVSAEPLKKSIAGRCPAIRCETGPFPAALDRARPFGLYLKLDQ